MIEKRGRIVVVGGGISGLAAAYELARARQDGARINELLIEGSPRLGGLIRTERRDGFVIEGGPDSFLSEKPEAAELARKLGLGEALVGSNDSERHTYILNRGRLVPLPDGTMLMIPTRLWPTLRSPLIPFASYWVMARDCFRRPSVAENPDQDESVASFVRRHFGKAVLENIADPLLAGVYGGDSETLSVQATLPRFWEMEQRHGSVIRAAWAARRRPQAVAKGQVKARPLFTTLQGGLEQLARGIVAKLEPSKVLLGRKVVAIARIENEKGRFVLRMDSGANYEADAVILALPGREVARLLKPIEPAAEELVALPYSSAVTVSLAYASRVALPPGFGFLVPRRENRRTLACTFVHRKFPGRAPEGKALLRCFLGGMRDPKAVCLSDDELVAIVLGELKEILGLNEQPIFTRVFRWPEALPQYTIGHRKRAQRILDRLSPERGIFLAGNTYSGIGISDCIRSGREAARQATRAISSSSNAPPV